MNTDPPKPTAKLEELNPGAATAPKSIPMSALNRGQLVAKLKQADDALRQLQPLLPMALERDYLLRVLLALIRRDGEIRIQTAEIKSSAGGRLTRREDGGDVVYGLEKTETPAPAP